MQTMKLIDVATDTWVEDFALEAGDLPFDAPRDWSVRKRVLHGGLREGVEVVEVHNGALSFTVVPTRGMGLWRGDYKGTTLGWKSPILGPVHPTFVELSARNGLGWLYGFDEWMVRCGLGWNGPPGTDTFTDSAGKPRSEPLTLHGRIANRPAHRLSVSVQPEAPHLVAVSGQVDEASLFGGRLRLTTTYSTAPNSNRLVIQDVVENLSGQATEMQMLYHTNFGPPLLEAGSRVIVPVKEIAPQTPRAADGIDTYDVYGSPEAGFAEQVYCVEPQADAEGKTAVMLQNAAGDHAVVLHFNIRELSCFTIWKNTAAVPDGYVTGLEPATGYPNFRGFERQRQRIRVLPPGGRWLCTWSMEVFDTAEAVTKQREAIERLQKAEPIIHSTVQARFSPL